MLLVFVREVVSKSNFAVADSEQKLPTTLPVDTWTGKRVLFIYAHIDDMEGSSAGLVSLLQGKAEVSLLILTNGDKGCGNVEICTNKTNADVAGIRQKEQLNSAQILGILAENVHFLSYEDCLLSTYQSAEVQQEIVGYIRKIQPHIVLTWDPTPYYDMIPSEGWEDVGYHPDHQTSGKLAVDSSWISHVDRLWPQLGAGWKIEQLYFFSFNPTKMPDFYVDVTGEPFQKKYEAFLEMKSQYTPGGEAAMDKFLVTWGTRVATQVGLPEGRVAEAFVYVLW